MIKKKYKDITPKFIDWNQYCDYKEHALMLCDKIYYLCKAYNIDIPCYDDGDIHRLILWNVNRCCCDLQSKKILMFTLINCVYKF